MSDSVLFPGMTKPPKKFRPRPDCAVRSWWPITPDSVLLSVDPSISSDSKKGTGWSVTDWFENRVRRIDSGTIKPVDSDDRSRFDCLANLLAQRIRLQRQSGRAITDAIIETPGAGGAWGQRSVDGLMRYARAVGICEATCFRAGLSMNRVATTEWKKQSKKQHAILIVKTYLGFDARDDNEGDSLAMAIWLWEQSALARRIGR